MKLGVVIEAFSDRPLDAVLAWLADAVPVISELELATGGYAPPTHCDRQLLLRDTTARERWWRAIEGRGYRVAALNTWGNPLHPDREVARRHDADLRETILLAASLGVDRVLALAGCPGDGRPRFAAGGWLPYLESDHERQWEEVGAPYWADLAAFARAQHPELLICIELHPGTLVYNLETFSALAAVGENLTANIDPSHFFWMQMDPLAVVSQLPRVGYGAPQRRRFRRTEPCAQRVARPPMVGRCARRPVALRCRRARARRRMVARVPRRAHGARRRNSGDRARGHARPRRGGILEAAEVVSASTGVPS